MPDDSHTDRSIDDLIQSERRLLAALDGARQGVWDYDARTGRTFYSGTWRTMRGYGADEFIDDSRDAWLSRLHPDDLEQIVSQIPKQNSGQDGYDTLEYRERRKDGRWVWILSRGKPVEWDEQGNAVRTIGTDTDITAMKEAEAALAAEKELLATTMRAVNDGMLSTDPRTIVTFVNPAAERLLGVASNAALGRPARDVFRLAGDDGDVVAKCLGAAGAQSVETDSVLISADGRHIDIRYSAAPVRSQSGETLAAVIVFQDMTHNRTMRRELEYAANHDSLTGLANRAAFGCALADLNPTGGNHVVCFIDLDHFKQVNDVGGHAAGDAVLVEVAGIIRATCRNSDLAARIGGDEFAILLRDCSIANGMRLAERVVEAVEGRRFVHEGRAFRIGASVGVVAVDGSDGVEDAMQRADAACYQAKANGRGRAILAA